MKFSKKEAISFGWETAKGNIKFFAALLLIVFLISIFLSFLEDIAKKKSLVFYFLTVVFSLVVSIILEMGLIRIWLNFSTSIQSKFSDLFSQYPFFFTYLFANFLYNLISLFGLILFIVPGIFLSMRLSFFKYFIIDKKSKILESLKESWEATKGNFWNLFSLYFLCGLINILGLICFFFGLFWTIPTTEIAKAFVYQKLKHGEAKVSNIN